MISNCSATDLQQWTFDPASKTIKNKQSGLCLAESSFPPIVGSTFLRIQPCGLDASQQFLFSRDGEIVDSSGSCINAADASGAMVKVGFCTYKTIELWGYGEPAPRMTRQHTVLGSTGKCLTSEPTAGATDWIADMQPCDGRAGQNWRFAPSKRLRDGTGRCAATASANDLANNGSPIVIRDCLGVWDPHPEQVWNPEVIGGKVRIIHDGSRCFDIRGPSAAAGTPVQVWACAGVANQAWTATPAFPEP